MSRPSFVILMLQNKHIIELKCGNFDLIILIVSLKKNSKMYDYGIRHYSTITELEHIFTQVK